MISNAIFKILSEDSTDITQAAAVAKYVLKDSAFTTAKLTLDHYQSLKTLCGETANNATDANSNPAWAVEHIRVHEKNYNINNIGVDLDVVSPLIILSFSNKKEINDEGDGEAILNIDVYTNPKTDNSNLAIAISNRIRSRFMKNPAYTGACSRSFIDKVPGLGSLNLCIKSTPVVKWDKVSTQYLCTYHEYLPINDAT